MVDLIDMQSQADEDYKFILMYRDHLTKFVQLQQLKTKRAEDVAYVLLDIFTIFSVQSILQNDNSREFANNVIKEMCNMWPELKMVHGKPRHSQSQDLVEKCNQDVENMLSSWLETNNTNKWSEGLRFVQLMKNRAHHTDINCSLYEAMFGAKLKVGLKNFIPNESLTNINMEGNLERLF
ncbi:KRAB-A domain-containing protein 2-like [Centruroides vittatus]|uniref:KRAB-A domain-containing protein 2-like n=1 Tax=Centruroides vittatus TaxID=120091 RepID=UPI00350FEE1B